MSKQDRTINLTDAQKNILNLEKYYFNKIELILKSKEFQKDLRTIENEIKLHYSVLSQIWEIKNKLKVAAERLVRHHIYKNMINEIKEIYESPISSDIGIILQDCILCIDCKTIDVHSNSNDIKYTIVEPNQTSFDNSNHNYIKVKSNLEMRGRRYRLPVLTYIVKIIYVDDRSNFDISTTNNIGKKPSIVLVCIPNGELSNLFDKDLILNFKTYKYFKEKDGKQFTPIKIPDEVDKKKINQWVENYCINERKWIKIDIPNLRGTKTIFFDAKNQCYWVNSSESKKPTIMAIKYGNTMRLNNAELKERYDSNSEYWEGYKEFNLE